jgi:hypothetical protein
MSLTRQYNANQLRDYSSLFSRCSVQEWLGGDLSSIAVKVRRYDDDWLTRNNASYLSYMQHVYGVLQNHYQNEYIMKNTFLNEWLIEEIGVSNSKIYSEFRVGHAIADLAMFNGSSKVFEIKTEFDTDKRLRLQLENYQKAFNQIYLIVPETKLKMYKSYGHNIGIITFDSKSQEKFSVFRKALKQSAVDSETIMHILHTNEYKEIVQTHYGYLPKMTSFNQFSICRSAISEIPSDALNEYFIHQMKKRGAKNALSSRNYKEFNQISLAMKMDTQNRNEMLQILKTKIIE